MTETGERDARVRDWMRTHWGGRAGHYAAHSAPRNRPFAEELVRLAGIAPGERVLDVAAGSGIVAVTVAAAVGPSGSVMATDLAPEWGDLVRASAEAAGMADRVAFRAMGAEALDLPDGGFDAALCQFGLMFVPEPVVALREMRRVLRDGGRLGVAVWSTADKVAHHLVSRLVTAALPPTPPEARMPSPLELAEPGLIERLVAAAGFRDVATTRRTFDVIVDDVEAEWRGRVELPGFPRASFTPEALARLHDEAIAALEAHRRDGAIRLRSEAIFVTAAR